MLLSHDIETTKPELEERIIQTAMIKYGREVSDLTNHELTSRPYQMDSER